MKQFQPLSNTEKHYISPEKGKTQGKARLIERNGLVYLQPGTELHPPEMTMSDKNKSRRLEVVKLGYGYVDPSTQNIILTKEYQINSIKNAWRLVMGSNDGNEKFRDINDGMI